MHEPLHVSSPHAGGIWQDVAQYFQLMVYVPMPVVGDYPQKQHGRYESGTQRRGRGSHMGGG